MIDNDEKTCTAELKLRSSHYVSNLFNLLNERRFYVLINLPVLINKDLFEVILDIVCCDLLLSFVTLLCLVSVSIFDHETADAESKRSCGGLSIFCSSIFYEGLTFADSVMSER